jgi:hypothetical protein
MPAGVPWPQYIKFFVAAMVSMLLGAQAVHVYYRPLDDLSELVQEEVERLNKSKDKIKP